MIVDDSKKFLLTIVYGHNKPADRRRFWSAMRTISAVIGNNAWTQRGDFNCDGVISRVISERLVGFMQLVHLCSRVSAYTV